MTTYVALTEWDEAYSGLRHTSIKVQGLILKSMENSRVWQRMRRIGGGAPGLWEDIANFLRNLLSYLRPWDLFQWLRWRVFDPLMAFIQWTFLDRLRNLFRPIIDSLRDVVTYWISRVRDAINSLRDRIWGVIASLPTNLYWLFQGILNGIRGALEAYRALFSWLVGQLPEWIRAPIRQMWETITSHIRMLWEVFGAFFNNLKVGIQASIGILTTFISQPLETIRVLWQMFVQSWQGGLLRSILDSLLNVWNAIIEALRLVWAKLHPIILEAAETAITVARPYVKRWVGAFESIPATFLNWVAGTAGTNLAMQPARALSTAGSLYGMSIAAGAAAMTLATALNIIPATNWVGAQQFAGFISEAAGFEPLTRATYGTLLNEVLIWPLRYHWNAQLRPKLPTEGTIFLMGRKRGIGRGEFYQAMAKQGIPNWWLDKIYLFFWTDPSPFWLARIAESTIPDWKPGYEWQQWADQWIPGWRSDPFKWLRAKLMLAGYETADVDSMIEGIQGKLVASATTQVKTSVRAMLRDAYWTKADAEGALRPLKVRQEEVELLYLAEELDYQKGYLDDQVRYYKEAFRKGEIHLQDLTLALSTIIVRSERVAQEVARERVRALKKPKSIVTPKEDPLVTRLRRQAIDSWVKLYRGWEIDREDLLLGLTIVVEDPDLAAEMVTVELTRVRPDPPVPLPPPKDPIIAKSERQAIASWVKAFRDEEVDSDELELGLAQLIPDAEVRLQIVQLEELRYRPTPDLIPPVKEDPIIAKIRAEKVRGHIEMFRKRLVVIEQLYLYLLADGLVEPVARATVITQATKRIRMPGIDSPYFLKDVMRDLIDQGLLAYEEMYMDKTITIDEYITWVTTLAADPDVVTYLADTLTLRRFLEGL